MRLVSLCLVLALILGGFAPPAPAQDAAAPGAVPAAAPAAPAGDVPAAPDAAPDAGGAAEGAAAAPDAAPPAPAGVAPISAMEVLRLVEDRSIGKTSRANMRMVLHLKGGGKKERELDLYRSKADNRNQNMFIHFLSPADMLNTTYLTIEKDRAEEKWIYLSSFKKVRKIVSKDNSSSFVSSDFTYEDLETIHADEFTTSEPPRDEKLGDTHVWVFDATKNDLSDSGYGKTTLFVCKERHIPLKVLLFDKSAGAHIKTLEVSDLKKVQDIWTAYATVMTDHRNGTKTVLELKKIEYDLPLPGETFTKRNMEK